MNIIEAMKAARKGAKVRRVGRKSSYVFFVPGSGGANFRESIFVGAKAGRFNTGFQPSYTDFISQWETAPEDTIGVDRAEKVSAE